jgi:polyphosphate kinase
MATKKRKKSRPEHERFINRELSFLSFARRVLEIASDSDVPLLERVKFAGIMGMLHDEFAMKRLSGLKRQIRRRRRKLSLDGRSPREEFDACRVELLEQVDQLGAVFQGSLRPALREAGIPIVDHDELSKPERKALRAYVRLSVLPILTPLAVDAEHPFPFISNLGLNLAVFLSAEGGQGERFVRIKVPQNRPRWIPLPERTGFVPLEQLIAANLDLMFPSSEPTAVHFFRVTRGAEGDDAARSSADLTIEEALQEPGSIVRQVSSELKARRFAGAVRLQVNVDMPEQHLLWLAQQLEVWPEDIYRADYFLGLADLMQLEAENRSELRFPPHAVVTHPRLRDLDPAHPTAIFEEIARGDVLLHHPYYSFDTSVLRFLQSAAVDPNVLAIKLTIYRTSRDSPIVRTLAEASRRGKQVAVLVEITARFDEAPNIAWGQFLEQEGCHVAYGVERLKTHVKLALVVREEKGQIRSYLHVGTGNYHSGTARIYEDLGLLTADPTLCEDASAVFNELTGSMPARRYQRMMVAPHTMRPRFVELIHREIENQRKGRPAGITAKMNQLQDPQMIRELYEASAAVVPITLIVRGVSCLRPGVPGLSETIRLFSVVGRFLEHSRIYRFDNGGRPEYFMGSADWMARNLNARMETIAPILDPVLEGEIDEIVAVYERDNVSAWDCDPEGRYVRRRPAAGEERRSTQEILIRRSQHGDHSEPDDG